MRRRSGIGARWPQSWRSAPPQWRRNGQTARLLPPDQMNAIINEASGERAMHHRRCSSCLQFVRPPSDIGPLPRERSDGTAGEEYGFTNVTIEDYPAARPGSRRSASCG